MSFPRRKDCPATAANANDSHDQPGAPSAGGTCEQRHHSIPPTWRVRRATTTADANHEAATMRQPVRYGASIGRSSLSASAATSAARTAGTAKLNHAVTECVATEIFERRRARDFRKVCIVGTRVDASCSEQPQKSPHRAGCWDSCSCRLLRNIEWLIEQPHDAVGL